MRAMDYAPPVRLILTQWTLMWLPRPTHPLLSPHSPSTIQTPTLQTSEDHSGPKRRVHRLNLCLLGLMWETVLKCLEPKTLTVIAVLRIRHIYYKSHVDSELQRRKACHCFYMNQYRVPCQANLTKSCEFSIVGHLHLPHVFRMLCLFFSLGHHRHTVILFSQSQFFVRFWARWFPPVSRRNPSVYILDVFVHRWY